MGRLVVPRTDRGCLIAFPMQSLLVPALLPPVCVSTHLGMTGLVNFTGAASQKSFCLEQLPRQLGKPMSVCSCVFFPKSNTQP